MDTRRARRALRARALGAALLSLVAFGCDKDPVTPSGPYTVSVSGWAQNLEHLCCLRAVEVALDGDRTVWRTSNSPRALGMLEWDTDRRLPVAAGIHHIEVFLVEDSTAPARYEVGIEVRVRDRRGTVINPGNRFVHTRELEIGEAAGVNFIVPE